MIRILLAKAGMAIAILFVVVTLTFFLAHLIPGDPARTILGNGATQQQLRAELRHQFGLDVPLWTRYLKSLDGLVHGNLGTSLITGQPSPRHSATRCRSRSRSRSSALPWYSSSASPQAS